MSWLPGITLIALTLVLGYIVLAGWWYGGADDDDDWRGSIR